MSSSAADWYTPPKKLDQQRQKQLNEENKVVKATEFSDLSDITNQLDDEEIEMLPDYPNDPVVRKTAQLIVDAIKGKCSYSTQKDNATYICLYDGPNIHLNKGQCQYLKKEFEDKVRLDFIFEPVQMYNQSGFAVYIRSLYY